MAEATATYAGLARDLRDWGFNLNLGPVVDVDVNPDNPIIGALGRSFSGDPEVVAAYAEAFVTGHRQRGRADGAQAFPGARLQPRGQPQGIRGHHADVDAGRARCPTGA